MHNYTFTDHKTLPSLVFLAHFTVKKLANLVCSKEGSRTRTGQRNRHRRERKGSIEQLLLFAAASSSSDHSFLFSLSFLLLSLPSLLFPYFSNAHSMILLLFSPLALLSSCSSFLFFPLACFQGLTGIKKGDKKAESKVEQRVKRTKLQVLLPSLSFPQSSVFYFSLSTTLFFFPVLLFLFLFSRFFPLKYIGGTTLMNWGRGLNQRCK